MRGTPSPSSSAAAGLQHEQHQQLGWERGWGGSETGVEWGGVARIDFPDEKGRLAAKLTFIVSSRDGYVLTDARIHQTMSYARRVHNRRRNVSIYTLETVERMVGNLLSRDTVRRLHVRCVYTLSE